MRLRRSAIEAELVAVHEPQRLVDRDIDLDRQGLVAHDHSVLGRVRLASAVGYRQGGDEQITVIARIRVLDPGREVRRESHIIGLSGTGRARIDQAGN